MKPIDFKLLCLFLLFAFPIFAQKPETGKVAGFVIDSRSLRPIQYASIGIMRIRDSSFAAGGVCDSTGFFIVRSIPYGSYYLKVIYMGYESLVSLPFSLNAVMSKKDFGRLGLKPAAALLKTATIVAKQILFDQVADTIQYHADAFKTHPDATAEDLISKMPGVTNNNGSISVNGEKVSQVTVDGKPFFGDDPTLAIRNLPAEVIDKIQVFDKQSDQALFTGFDDGQTTKTINIVTKSEKSNGEFGKFYAGYGSDGRYIAGGNFNYFDGDRRISFLGLSNNINTQNFSSQDLLGVTGGSGGRGGGSGGGSGGSSGGSSGNAGANFLVGPRNGITTTNALGINYSDKWGSKIKVTASYFFNVADNSTYTDKNRIYVGTRDNGQLYTETDSASNTNYNQRFNMRLEYSIDTANSIIEIPKLNLQNYNSALGMAAQMMARNPLTASEFLQSQTYNNTPSLTKGYDFANSLLWRHKFKKKGRTFSAGLSTDLNDKSGSGTQLSRCIYYSPSDTVSPQILTLNQDNPVTGSGYMLSPNLVYTEPTDSFGQLQFSYNPSYTLSNVNQPTYNYGLFPFPAYSVVPDTALSNRYQSINTVNKAGIGYRRNRKKLMIMLGVNFQIATLTGSENLPLSFAADKSFKDLLPQATFNYRFAKGTNLRIIYRASTTIPSIGQLQSVINNNNPLMLSTGNPALRQDYEQTVTVRYGKTRSTKSSGLFIYFYANYAQNYLGNQTLNPSKDSAVAQGIVLKSGAQLSRPVNINGFFSTKSFATYALPISKIKCNLNLNTGLNYSQTPGLINSATNISGNTGITGGVGLSSNISEKIDFTFACNANYNIVSNSLTTAVPNNNFYSQTISLKFNWLFLDGFVFNTTVNHSLYQGLSQNYNLNWLLWNASLGYKLLKDRSFEVKFSVFDLLNQNNNISRSVNSNYIEDDRTNVLTRYFMITLTYTLRKFKEK